MIIEKRNFRDELRAPYSHNDVSSTELEYEVQLVSRPP